MAERKGAPRSGGGGLQPGSPLKPPKIENKKKNLQILCYQFLRDFPFNRNQPLKSADDWYLRILKNKLIKLKIQDDRTL
jgi:hypothetical protein